MALPGMADEIMPIGTLSLSYNSLAKKYPAAENDRSAESSAMHHPRCNESGARRFLPVTRKILMEGLCAICNSFMAAGLLLSARTTLLFFRMLYSILDWPEHNQT